MKIGIIINGYHQPPALMAQVERLKSCLIDKCEVEVISTTSIIGYIGRDTLTVNTDIDAAIYLDKDIDIARMLESYGIRLFNSANAIAMSDNKMSTHIMLSNAGVSSPVTIASPLYYRGDDDEKFLEKTAEIVGFPMVIKECHGSFGAQVYLAHNLDEAQKIRQRLLGKPHIYQEYISTSAGHDTRVIVIGGQVVASMRRVNDSDFRSNIELGGNAIKIDNLNEKYSKIAIKSAFALGLEYAGIDILDGEDGEPIVCEVNSNAYFNAISKVTGVDVARKYADYILNMLFIEKQSTKGKA